MFLINILLKDNLNFKGVIGKFDKINMKKVLLLKIKNSTVIFHYPIIIEIY